MLSDAERDDLLAVAAMLDVPTDEALDILASAKSRAEPTAPPARSASMLHVGDRVAFTGDMAAARSDLEAKATAAGLRVTSSVSHLTTLLVAADPHSQSAKARSAHEHHVRVVCESVFVQLCSQVLPAVD